MLISKSVKIFSARIFTRKTSWTTRTTKTAFYRRSLIFPQDKDRSKQTKISKTRNQDRSINIAEMSRFSPSPAWFQSPVAISSDRCGEERVDEKANA
jgi:hypothetical protein